MGVRLAIVFKVTDTKFLNGKESVGGYLWDKSHLHTVYNNQIILIG